MHVQRPTLKHVRTHCTDSVGHWKCDKELKSAAANPTSFLKSAAICVCLVCVFPGL
jgi:hypothetical protein